MWTVTLVKFRHRPTKADLDGFSKNVGKFSAKGIKIHMSFWTIGRYDAVLVGEAPDEKTAMQFIVGLPDVAATETLVAVQRDEAIKWVQ